MTPLLQPLGPGLFYEEGDVSFGRVAHVLSPNKIHNQGLDGFHAHRQAHLRALYEAFAKRQ